ncbi:MAG: putative adhesin [Pseudomonas sp.]
MAIEFGIVSLNIASANLPGARQAEKKQVILAALSFGLLQLAPYTPRLLRSFGKLTAPVKTAVRKAPVAVVAKSFGSLLNRSIAPRNTRLETFFGTNSLLKTWSIAAHPVFRTSLVKIWKLEQKFLLWTSGKGQARTLVVSTHGYHLPGSRNTPIPSRTELHVYAPHGYILIDPGLHRIIRRRVNPLAILKNTENTLVSAPNLPTPYVMTDKLLAGTSQPGMIKNYSLSKYQTPQYESYDTIGHAVSNSNQSPFHGHLPSAPMDVLTVRNRFGMIDPTLDDLFTTLSRQGIHYEKILLVHCRCSAIDAAMQRAPVYRAE